MAKLLKLFDGRAVTDDEKHEFCQKRGYPGAVFLPPSLYREAERQGYDMRYYVEQTPIPSDERSAAWTSRERPF